MTYDREPESIWIQDAWAWMDFPEKQGYEFDQDLKELKIEVPSNIPDTYTVTKVSRDLGDHIKDSGTRSEFETGAVRDGQSGKGRFDLLPMMAMFRLAKHYERGCLKYGDRNWEKGIPISRYIDSAMRHLLKFAVGCVDEHHLTAAAWNITCAMETMDRISLGVLPLSLDDRAESLFGVEYEAFEEQLNEVL